MLVLVTLLRRFAVEYVGEVPAKIQSTMTRCSANIPLKQRANKNGQRNSTITLGNGTICAPIYKLRENWIFMPVLNRG